VTGFVVQPDDDDALLEALEKLVTNAELRHSMGSAARERAERAFSLKQAPLAGRRSSAASSPNEAPSARLAGCQRLLEPPYRLE
jgi:hypothetical protein